MHFDAFNALLFVLRFLLGLFRREDGFGHVLRGVWFSAVDT